MADGHGVIDATTTTASTTNSTTPRAMSQPRRFRLCGRTA
jgi:hypothetical protein